MGLKDGRALRAHRAFIEGDWNLELKKAGSMGLKDGRALRAPRAFLEGDWNLELKKATGRWKLEFALALC